MNDIPVIRKLTLYLWIWTWTTILVWSPVWAAPTMSKLDMVDDTASILYFQSGQTLDRTCWSFYESTWILPDNEKYRLEDNDHDPWRSGRASIVETLTPTGWFKAKLVLKDLRYTDTGYYMCRGKSSTFDDVSNYSGNEPPFSRIYVLVSSANPNQVFLHVKEDNSISPIRQVAVWRNRDSFVHCLATRLDDLDLSLTIDGMTEREYQYDVRYGFLLPANSLQSDEARSARCLATVNATNPADGGSKSKIVDRIQLVLIPIEHTELLEPRIVRGGDELPYKNGRLDLHCLYPEDGAKKPEIVFINCSWSQIPNQQGVKFIRTTGSNQTLRIENLTSSHAGNYSCSCWHAVDHHRETVATIRVDVSPTRGRLFYLSPHGPAAFRRSIGESVRFSVQYTTWPPNETESRWFHRFKNPLGGLKVDELIENRRSKSIELSNLRANQSGVYAFRITVGGDLQREVRFTLIVESPLGNFRTFLTEEQGNETLDGRFLEYGKNYSMFCSSDGFPLAEIKIMRNPCIGRKEEATTDCAWTEIEVNGRHTIRHDGDFGRSVEMRMTTRTSGQYRCDVTEPGTNSSVHIETLNYIVSDIDRSQDRRALSLSLITEDSSGEIYETDTVIAVCQYQPLVYSEVIWVVWSDLGKWTPIEGDQPIESKVIDTGLSATKNLTFANVFRHHRGIYRCLGVFDAKMGTGLEIRQVEIFLNATVPLVFGNLTSPHEQTLGYSPLEIYCDARGAPKPSIVWLKDNAFFEIGNWTDEDGHDDEDDSRNIRVTNDSRLLTIRRPTTESGGVYTCLVKNRFEVIHADFKIRLSNVLVQHAHLIYGILSAIVVGLLIAVVTLVVCLVLTKRSRKKSVQTAQRNQRRQLREHLMASADADLQLNPDQPVNDQIDNLPYDRQYEIRAEDLTLGRLLGEGQYGRVFEGVLKTGDGRKIVAAVKMPKTGTNPEQHKALLSEFKIMIYIENHVNVLRLLGVITEHMVDGKLYVVVEYCRLGSLADYLKRTRDQFVDELITTTEPPEEAYQSSVDNDGYLVPNCQNGETSNNSGYRTCCQKYRAELDPSWSRKNVRRRNQETFVSTTDLLSYSYQVANAMDFLTSKKIIHRDLAVRNVLLNENKIVKICDFGLARHDYTYNATKVGVPLPVKWMAIESILFQEYTVKSDVWSFGVVVWEIFSLAQTPYPGQAVDRNFIRWLKDEENRMTCPDYAPDKIYSIMRQCWLSIPDDRPTFAECRRRIGRELIRCSIDSYRELLNALTISDDVTESESPPAPAPVGCLRFNSSQSEDDQQPETMNHEDSSIVDGDSNQMENEEAAENLMYFDCNAELEWDDGMEMQELRRGKGGTQ